jgi:hypothetical protein
MKSGEIQEREGNMMIIAPRAATRMPSALAR